MAELKTKKTNASVADFIDAIEDEQRRDDCKAIIRMMQTATGAEPRMWGSSIIGFGEYKFKYESGRELDWFKIGFSPRKQAITLYLLPGFGEVNQLLKKLGKYKLGKGCLYIKSLDDVDSQVLQEVMNLTVKTLRH